MATVVLGVTGSIAAYKAAELCSRLRKEGFSVYVVMTPHAAEFVSPLTFESLSGHPVAVALFSRAVPHEIEHISLARRADVFLVAPASANLLGKYACGIADDLLTTTLLATSAPVVIAPAMNAQMYASDAVQRNVEILRARGVRFVGPASGHLACGEEGEGRLAELEDIVAEVKALLQAPQAAQPEKAAQAVAQDYAGVRVLVSAGPTREAIDPVRYISNRASGKMGYAIAQAAAKRGAQVVLVSGPTALDAPDGVRRVDVVTAREMCEAMLEAFDDCDIVIKAAAPADFTPVASFQHKLKKTGAEDTLTLQLVQTEDILQKLAGRRKAQRLIGFAAETRDVSGYARDKLARKGLDMIVANDVTQAGAGFDVDTNIVTLITPKGEEALPLMSKEAVAHRILDKILTL